MTLPAATGGDGALSYSLCALPAGVTFDAASRRISGTPTTTQRRKTCTWRVTDADNDTAEADKDKRIFSILVTETPIIVVEPTELTVVENGSRNFKVKLGAAPSGQVTISATSTDADAAQVAIESPPLIFRQNNWSTATTVTVEAPDDLDASDESVTISLSASGGGYDGTSATVQVMVDDDDEQGIEVKPSSLALKEGDPTAGTGVFEARLKTQPTGDVTVSVTKDPVKQEGMSASVTLS